MMVRVLVVTPVPLHSAQGCSMIEPLPLHSVHGSENPNAPWLRLTTQAPLQFGHTLGLVPGRAPLPWQLVHGAGLVSRNGIATPLVASRNDSSVWVSRSLPRRGRLGRGEAPRPNSPPNRSPMLAPPVCPAASKARTSCPLLREGVAGTQVTSAPSKRPPRSTRRAAPARPIRSRTPSRPRP